MFFSIFSMFFASNTRFWACEAPWFALKAIRDELASQMSVPLEIQHRFARGLEPI